MRMHCLKKPGAPLGSRPIAATPLAYPAALVTRRCPLAARIIRVGPLLVLPLLVHGGCAGPRIRHVDEKNRTCVLDDGTQARYVPPRVKHSGAVPRIPREPPASGATRGVYDCLISAGGALTGCRVLQSIGSDDELMIGALATWTFEPARCAERPIDARRSIDVSPQWVPSCVNIPLGTRSSVRRAVDGGELAGTGRSNAPRLIREDETCIAHDGREGKLERPQVISGRAPTYSKMALEQRQQGELAVRCLIRRTGEVEDCHLVCSDSPLLEENLLDTPASWRMEPARCAGEPFDTDYTFSFRFTLPASR